MIPTNRELLSERRGPRKGAKTWDTAIMSIVGVIILAVYVVADSTCVMAGRVVSQLWRKSSA